VSCVIVVSFFVYYIVRGKIRTEHHHRETMSLTSVKEKGFIILSSLKHHHRKTMRMTTMIERANLIFYSSYPLSSQQ